MCEREREREVWGGDSQLKGSYLNTRIYVEIRAELLQEREERCAALIPASYLKGAPL